MTEVILADEGIETLFGTLDENLRGIERALGVSLTARGNRLQIDGEPEAARLAESLVSQLSTLLEKGYRLRPEDVSTAVRVIREAPQTSLVEFFLGDSLVERVREKVKPRSLQQQRYLQAMAEHDLVVSIGPAGTGKTYLAVAMAAVSLLEKRVRRIVLTRPAVEAGEKLGFLPGDLVEKVNPYLRPLYDALYDILGFDKVSKMLERQAIEVAPLAFMRGRTLNDSFIILDEAQNTTSEQMKMFLTRVGFNSRAVVNGDVTQVDLPPGKVSGLREAEEVLAGIAGIQFVRFTERDVVRHELVQQIVLAYERHQRRGEESARRNEPPGRGVS
ncbi:MAG: PhoH family protein [Thermoanaerobaculia bacterium]